MSGLAPFDIVPETVPEIVLTCIAIFLGLIISVVIISSSTTALQAMDGKTQLARQKLETLMTYLQLKQVPQYLIEKIVDFFEYQMTATKCAAMASNRR